MMALRAPAPPYGAAAARPSYGAADARSHTACHAPTDGSLALIRSIAIVARLRFDVAVTLWRSLARHGNGAVVSRQLTVQCPHGFCAQRCGRTPVLRRVFVAHTSYATQRARARCAMLGSACARPPVRRRASEPCAMVLRLRACCFGVTCACQCLVACVLPVSIRRGGRSCVCNSGCCDRETALRRSGRVPTYARQQIL